MFGFVQYKKKGTIKYKIFMNLILIGIIPLLFTAGVVYVYTLANINRTYDEEMRAKLEQCKQSIESKLLGALNYSDLILSNSYILQNLNRDFTSDTEAVMEFHYMLNLTFTGQLEQNKVDLCFYVNNESLPPGRYIDKFDAVKNIPQAVQIMNSSRSEVLWQPEIRLDDKLGPYIALYRNIVYGSRPIGVLVVKLPFESLHNFISKDDLPEGSALQYRYDGKNENIYGNLKKGRHFEKPLMNGASLYLVSSGNVNYSKTTGVTLFIICGFLIAFRLIYAIAAGIAKSITYSLETFVDSLACEDGEKISDVTGHDNIHEVNVIKKKFINLINTVEQSYKEISVARQKHASLELELLQQHINPHMLYNSLSVINWAVKRERNEKVQTLIKKLISYYRNVLNKGSAVTTTQKEIELLQDYVDIHSLSYQCEIEFNTSIAPEAAHCYIPKMLLQPFIENSLMHGLKGRSSASIEVTVEKVENSLVFIVKDNGRGMSQEKIDQILQENNGGYGIQNTINRIKLYYGDSYGVSISSVPKEGTSVKVTIGIQCPEELKPGINKIESI